MTDKKRIKNKQERKLRWTEKTRYEVKEWLG